MTMTLTAAGLDGHDDRVDDDRPKRRRFTAEYKLKILNELDAATGHGEAGAILRREGLYSSHVVEWRRARERGALAGLSTPERLALSPERRRVERLEAENARLRAKLDATQTALEIAGKAFALLETLSESADSDLKSTT